MTYIDIFNFVTNEKQRFAFERLIDAEDFASNYSCSEDEEISIGNGTFSMEWEDYLSF